ncbi:hypothetical protein EYF80_023388 [Liparis tanakae]|uniref:Uncharacterized protein n=1 Tax=Liparis tanakae TaxID=230148 RepID=A0A4Z2HKE6_9TELE|nr:hypothetical protein EYF80_023388 [Liparis tanakae]
MWMALSSCRGPWCVGMGWPEGRGVFLFPLRPQQEPPELSGLDREGLRDGKLCSAVSKKFCWSEVVLTVSSRSSLSSPLRLLCRNALALPDLDILILASLAFYMRLKLETITGTGRAITSTPLREQMEPKIFPAIVFGTMSPYLEMRRISLIGSSEFPLHCVLDTTGLPTGKQVNNDGNKRKVSRGCKAEAAEGAAGPRKSTAPALHHTALEPEAQHRLTSLLLPPAPRPMRPVTAHPASSDSGERQRAAAGSAPRRDSIQILSSAT